MGLKTKLKDCSSKPKPTAYKTFVRSILEYAVAVFNPYTKCNINKLERIQKKASRFIFNKYGRKTSISELYIQAGLPLLQNFKKTNRLKFIFNLINGNYNLGYQDYFHFNPSRVTRNKHSKSISEIKPRTDCYKYSYFPRVIHVWNAFPNKLSVQIV
uniref:Putative endonuclease/reverse transcriptase n=1 Tax=Ixodes ricinus TaxID=34613 RepID=A0A6B0UWH2_IXORI